MGDVMTSKMLRWSIVLLVGYSLLFVSHADGSQMPRTWLWSPYNVPAKYQRMLAESKMPTPRGTLEIVFGFCPDYQPGTVGGCAYETAIWLLPNLKPGEDEFVFYHELGHIADFRHLNDSERARITRLLNLVGLPWWGREQDYFPGSTAPIPAESFADAYSECASVGFFVVPEPEAAPASARPAVPGSICRSLARMVKS